MVFTDDPTKNFEDFASADFSRKDDNLGIQYEKDEIFEDTLLLLRYNCPEKTCDVACLGWPDLHRHVKSKHGKMMWYVFLPSHTAGNTKINLLNGRVDIVIFVLETKKFSLMNMRSSPRRSCASTKSTVTTFLAPLTRVVSEGTRNAVSVVNGSTEMTSCMRIVVTDMNDAISATDDLDIASSSTTSTITPSKTTSRKATSFA